jgi:hypothetical protein
MRMAGPSALLRPLLALVMVLQSVWRCVLLLMVLPLLLMMVLLLVVRVVLVLLLLLMVVVAVVVVMLVLVVLLPLPRPLRPPDLSRWVPRLSMPTAPSPLSPLASATVPAAPVASVPSSAAHSALAGLVSSHLYHACIFFDSLLRIVLDTGSIVHTFRPYLKSSAYASWPLPPATSTTPLPDCNTGSVNVSTSHLAKTRFLASCIIYHIYISRVKMIMEATTTSHTDLVRLIIVSIGIVWILKLPCALLFPAWGGEDSKPKYKQQCAQK